MVEPMKPTSSLPSPREPTPDPERRSKGSFFWLSFIAVVTSIFLSALDLTAVATTLPTITSDLNGGDDFSWVGSAYALSSTAFLPLSGALADVFGRKPVMMGSILLFGIGSALAGAAQTMTMLIIARSTSMNSRSFAHSISPSCSQLFRDSVEEVSSTSPRS